MDIIFKGANKMTVIKVAILGFGTVGEGVYRTIHSHQEQLKAVLGKNVEVAAILIKNKQKKRNIDENVMITTNFNDILNLPQLDVVVEAIVGKEQPAEFLKQAIQKGCHIISANKEMIAYYGNELFALASEHNVTVGFEATVGGGIPIIQTLRELLKINRVQQIQGIVNGTSNFILTQMRENRESFAAALLQAQENGFAEADPTNDVEGYDAFYKTMILSRIAFGAEPDWNAVEREGITSITSELVEAAESIGLRFKHMAELSKSGKQIQGSVQPALVSKSHPFYHIEGVQNAFNIQTDIVGSITLQGPGAGMFPSASAVIEDLVYVCQNQCAGLPAKVDHEFQQTEEQQRENGLWFVYGVQRKRLNPAITWVDQISEDAYVVKAARIDLLQQELEGYFPIIGEYEISKNEERQKVL
jgi:homoserine dehydrogenase